MLLVSIACCETEVVVYTRTRSLVFCDVKYGAAKLGEGMYSEVDTWMPSMRFDYVLCRVSGAIYDITYLRTALCYVIAQRVVVILYRRFGTNYQSQL